MYVLFFVYTFEGVVMQEDLDLVVYLLSDLYLWHAFRCFFLEGTLKSLHSFLFVGVNRGVEGFVCVGEWCALARACYLYDPDVTQLEV